MKTQEYLLVGIMIILIVVVGFQFYSMMGLSKQIKEPVRPTSSATTASVTSQPSSIKLPANIQSSAPIHFKSIEEEIAYYKKNAKNPKNIDIEKAVRNMDQNLDGQCDKCGMAILHCIESGMEDM